MDGWDRIRAHLQSTYRLVIDEPALAGLVWRFATSEQRQLVEPIAVYGTPHVMVTCSVGPENSMSADAALRANGDLPIGALCLARGVYILRSLYPIASLELGVFDRSLELLAREGIRLRRPPPPPAPYYE